MTKFDQYLEGLWANINKARKKGTTSSKWKNDPKYRSKLKKAVKKLEETGLHYKSSPAIPPETEYEKSAGEHKRRMARKAEKHADARQAKRDAARKGGRERMKPHELGEGKKKKKAPRAKVYDPVSGKYYTPRKMPESVDNINEKKADRCKRRADSVYGKKTSAYKSGAIVRCRQGKIWKKK